jgi:peptidoglycan/xylan/chitin deacetylase (PgdA/CDA1 family)
VGRVGHFAGRAALEALAVSRAHALAHVVRRVAGVVLRIERVRPPRSGRFQPNRFRELTPEFLEAMIIALRRRKIEIVSLDEMRRRLTERDTKRARFACITCDGGYIEHQTVVQPICRKHEAPFAAFVPTGFVDRIGAPWSLVLETVIAKNDRLALLIDEREQRLDCRTAGEKSRVFAALWSWLMARPTNDDISRSMADLTGRYAVDVEGICAEACMGWKEVAALAADPAVTIGAQSVNYPILAKLPDPKVRFEMDMSRSVIESAIGVRPQHFAYPFGRKDAAADREFEIAAQLGFASALTSRRGAIRARHAFSLTALPRVSLSGDFQRLRYLSVALSGVRVGR